MAYEGQGSLKHIAMGRPLLYFIGQEERPDDYEALIENFIKNLMYRQKKVCYWSVMVA